VPSHADPEVPAEFDALIVKAMAKARDERQSSMQEIEQALVAWQSAAVPLARPRTGSVATVLDEAMWRDDTQLAVAPPEAARVVQSTAAPVAQVEVVELEAAPVARVEVEVRAPEPTAGLETVVANLLSDTDAVVVRPHAARRPGRGFPALMIGLVGAVAVAVVMMKFGVTATPAPEAAKMERAASTKPLGEETGPEVRRVAEPAEPQVSIVAPEPMKEPEPEPRKADVTPDDPVKAERVGKNKPETEVRAPRPEPNKATRAPAKISPWPEIKRRAQICRAQHDAAGGASIVIEYSVDHKGEVMHAVASEGSALGTCLAKAVEQATFEPKLRLGVEVAL
jgi:hypothetical protein